MDLGLTGKHVLVTGGARGIGLGIAQAFLNEDAVVTILDCNHVNLRLAEGVLGKEVGAIETNISSVSDVLDAVEKAECDLPIDILVNNAGVSGDTLFLKLTFQEWRRIIDTNLTGTFLVSQEVAKRMVKRGQGGVIINMSSKNGLFGETGLAHYNASKAGIIALTQTMALELASYNIRVNAVCPGYLVTPMSREIDPPGFAEDFAKRYIAMGRTGTIDDVTGAFLFLASNQARWITGQTMVIDGGQLCGQTPGSVERKRFVEVKTKIQAS
ncbi:MAG: SDR family NAD(P)-dependent oxidoreductase [Patescibacteria group bacterium]